MREKIWSFDKKKIIFFIRERSICNRCVRSVFTIIEGHPLGEGEETNEEKKKKS